MNQTRIRTTPNRNNSTCAILENYFGSKLSHLELEVRPGETDGFVVVSDSGLRRRINEREAQDLVGDFLRGWSQVHQIIYIEFEYGPYFGGGGGGALGMNGYGYATCPGTTQTPQAYVPPLEVLKETVEKQADKIRNMQQEINVLHIDMIIDKGWKKSKVKKDNHKKVYWNRVLKRKRNG